MEKLILRSVLYGADKIPDKWFEKVPGGFFKEKNGQSNDKPNDKINDKGPTPKDSGRHRTSDNRRDKPVDSHRGDRGRSDGRRRPDRRRSSYDGGADSDDDDYYHSEDDRRRSRRDKPHQRRHSVDDDRYGYNNGHDRKPHDDRAGRVNGKRSPHGRDRFVDHDRPSSSGSSQPSNRPPPKVSIPTNGARGVAAEPPPAGPSPTTGHAQGGNPTSPTVSSPLYTQHHFRNGGMEASSYVPYSHIYNQERPSSSSPVAPPPMGYAQNPFAQQAQTAVDAGAGMDYNGKQGFINRAYDPQYSPRRDPGYDGSEEARYDTSSPPQARPSTREYDSPHPSGGDGLPQQDRGTFSFDKSDLVRPRGRTLSNAC